MSTSQYQLVAQVARLFPDAIFYKETTEKVVALTIDDAPTPNDLDDQSTHLLLDTIAAHNQEVSAIATPVRATFFIISGHLCDNPTILHRILKEGHEIGNHGTADETTALLHPDLFAHQLQTAHQCLSDRCGHPIRWYRPGRGLYNKAMLQTLQQMPGYVPRFALASMIPIDTFKPTNDAQFTAWYVSRFVFPGAILVLHGGSEAQSQQTAKALKLLLRELHNRQYRVVTLSELWDL